MSSERSTAAWTTRSPIRCRSSPTSAIFCSRTPGSHALNERLGFFAHELRNLIQKATLAVSALKAGNVGLAGATGAVLDRSLIGLRNLVDRSLADVRVSAGMPPRRELIPLAAFIAEVKISAALEAQARGCGLDVSAVDPRLAVEADRELLFSAVGNLLQNAFKFTEQNTDVLLHAHAVGDRVLLEVEDSCGGLPAGDADRMFRPFTQDSADKSGLGLGLSICRRSVEANGGLLSVRDVPGSGCVFTIDLPRHAAPRQAPPANEVVVDRPGPGRHAHLSPSSWSCSAHLKRVSAPTRMAAAVDYGDEGSITECGGYVRVDFNSCNVTELSELYRGFATFCLDNDVTRALLKAGDNDPNGHYRLRDALHSMAQLAQIPAEFKLALIPSTHAIEAIYREAQRHLRAAGLNAWVFAEEEEAVDWLEGRAPAGRAAS